MTTIFDTLSPTAQFRLSLYAASGVMGPPSKDDPASYAAAAAKIDDASAVIEALGSKPTLERLADSPPFVREALAPLFGGRY